MAAAAGGYVVLAWMFRGAPGRAERRVFSVLNDAGEMEWLRVPQQLGTPWMLPAVASVAWATERRRDAVVALAALPVEKAIEVGTKKLVKRPRPIWTQPTALRDDAPVEGPSYPSGHAAIAVCATLLLAPHLPRPAARVLLAATAVSTLTRVHQGAHQPVDALGGTLLGYVLARGLTGLSRATA